MSSFGVLSHVHPRHSVTYMPPPARGVFMNVPVACCHVSPIACCHMSPASSCCMPPPRGVLPHAPPRREYVCLSPVSPCGASDSGCLGAGRDTGCLKPPPEQWLRGSRAGPRRSTAARRTRSCRPPCRARRFHRQTRRGGAQTGIQSHPVSRCLCPQQPPPCSGGAGQTGQR